MQSQSIQGKVLSVEDSEDNQLIIKLHLQKLNTVVFLAKNGQEGIDSFKTENYDLVLMDLQMPVMNGYDATKAIREWETTNQRPETPIVALTASATSEEIEKALSVGCNDHLSKPLRRDDLQRLLIKYGIIKKNLPVKGTSVFEKGNGNTDKYIAILDVAFKDLVPQILEIKRRQAKEVEDALIQHDFEKIRKLGHKIRGSHGLEVINGLGRELEDAAKDKDIQTSRAISNELMEYLNHVEVRFQKDMS